MHALVMFTAASNEKEWVDTFHRLLSDWYYGAPGSPLLYDAVIHQEMIMKRHVALETARYHPLVGCVMKDMDFAREVTSMPDAHVIMVDDRVAGVFSASGHVDRHTAIDISPYHVAVDLVTILKLFASDLLPVATPHLSVLDAEWQDYKHHPEKYPQQTKDVALAGVLERLTATLARL